MAGSALGPWSLLPKQQKKQNKNSFSEKQNPGLCIDFPSKDLLAHICEAHEYFYSPYLIVRAVARPPILPLTKTNASLGRRRRLLMRCRLLWQETKAAIAPGEGGGFSVFWECSQADRKGKTIHNVVKAASHSEGPPRWGPRGLRGVRGHASQARDNRGRHLHEREAIVQKSARARKQSYISFITRQNRTQ